MPSSVSSGGSTFTNQKVFLEDVMGKTNNQDAHHRSRAASDTGHL